MKIGIIGAGNIGGALAQRFVELGHDVAVANSRGPETLHGVEAETGATAVTVAEAARGKDVVVVTIPLKNVTQLPDDLIETAEDVVVVDTCNYYPRERDGSIEAIEAGMPESMWVSQQLGRPVVKAFNNIYAQHLRDNGRPAGAPHRVALPVAGDDAAAKATVMKLVEELGFDPVDGGSLEESWRQQPGTPVYATDFDAEGVLRGLAEASPERPPDFRATPNSPGSFTEPA